MKAIHRSRCFGRLLAAWLLLWFLAMSAAPLGPLSSLGGLRSTASVANEAQHVADCGAGAAEHQHSHHHQPGQAAETPDTCAGVPVDVHAGHTAGSLSHCPLCLHGAAPPVVVLAALAGAGAPAERATAARRSVLRTRTEAPPPARGPPDAS